MRRVREHENGREAIISRLDWTGPRGLKIQNNASGKKSESGPEAGQAVSGPSGQPDKKPFSLSSAGEGSSSSIAHEELPGGTLQKKVSDLRVSDTPPVKGTVLQSQPKNKHQKSTGFQQGQQHPQGRIDIQRPRSSQQRWRHQSRQEPQSQHSSQETQGGQPPRKQFHQKNQQQIRSAPPNQPGSHHPASSGVPSWEFQQNQVPQTAPLAQVSAWAQPRKNTGKSQQAGPAPQTPSSQSGKTRETKGAIPKQDVKDRTQQTHILSQSFTIPMRDPKQEFKKGNRKVLDVNLLPLNLNKLCEWIFHYDIATDPERPKRLLREVVDKFIKKHFPTFRPAFDGKKNLYTSKPLPFPGNRNVLEDTISVTNLEKPFDNVIEFRVAIKLAQKINTSEIKKFLNSKGTPHNVALPQSAIQAIDVILRAAPLASRALPIVPVGRNFFIEDRPRIVSLGGGLELWNGFYQSAILNWKPFLNIDVAHKGFPEPKPLIELYQEVCGIQSLDQTPYPIQKDRFRGFVTTLQIDYSLPGNSSSKRTHRIIGIGKCTRDLRFPLKDDGPEISVDEYFRTVKNYRIKYSNLPTVQVDPAAKNIYLPMELCSLKSGQVLHRKLDEKQTAVMVRKAAQPPEVRKEKILRAIQMAKYNQSPVVKDFGIEVNETMASVDARILETPSVEYAKPKQIIPRLGVWNAGEFLRSQALSNWFILNLDTSGRFPTKRSQLDKLCDELIRQGKAVGMVLRNPAGIVDLDTRDFKLVKSKIINLFKEWKENHAELVVVVLPDRGGQYYSMVKQCAELNVGILTQCLKSSTVQKRVNSATCKNILSKLNAKTNGVNHIVPAIHRPPVLQDPVMFVGIDVTHPSPDQTSIPSVAAVSASHDAKAFQYNMIWRLQNPREEIVRDLKNIIKEQLEFFHKKTGYKPEKIIVYRDGVLAAELTAIREACKEMPGEDYNPGITFLVVQKRHHVRFFPRQDIADQKTGNVPPGTIVDTEITHPRELDFYLVSHASLQGTARPTKYHRLWDDNDILEDELEKLTYYLCYLFTRCTRSVSYPAPTYYAHLAAFRARAYLENNPFRLQELEEFAKKNKIEENFLMASPMFFV
ncbi:unnamed protein product [Bemisia tabaci]|uniref:Uncharacterized protein n=1 Tax=Bemisia tabaci TaxID=7038 RepID=A0A9P0AC87_BEMTA|nr:unnamed protein product [Bemisia tabaci]